MSEPRACDTEHLRNYPDCFEECDKDKCDGVVSRSIPKKIAAQKGLPAPDFSTSEAELREKIKTILYKAEHREVDDGNTFIEAALSIQQVSVLTDQILALLPQYEPVQLEGLTDEEIGKELCQLKDNEWISGRWYYNPYEIMKATIAKNSKETLYRRKA